MSTEWGDNLLPHHAKLLRDSAITPEVARARGYWSAEKKCELAKLGFSGPQQLAPAFVIPIRNTRGEVVLHQIRPDDPRCKSNGKPLKYETPRGARMALDVPPKAREGIDDPSLPLVITEGARKADAAVSAGLCCVSLLGVWNFRGSNTKGGKVALADWENVALNGRKVYICFDSDVMEKVEVHRALARLGEFLSSRGARVSYIYLPAGEGGAKVGLDDYLAQGRTIDDLLGLASTKLRKPPDEPEDGQRAGPYRVRDGRIVHLKAITDEQVEVPLCNFSARIEREELHDDGVERTSVFQISGSHQSGAPLPMVRVPADRFSSLNWITSAWGNGPVIYAGYGARDHLRCAIQMFSPDIPRQIVYTHLGWRKIGDEWVYLHAGGAIGPNGPVLDVLIDPPEALSRYNLPAPAEGEEVRQAVQASLQLLELAPDRVAFPGLAAVYRSVVGSTDFSLHYAGPTGVFKTEIVALYQSHFGSELDARHLPGSWSSTANASEGIAFAAKDALLVIDDFAPHGTNYDVQRAHREADRVLRAQGNRSGRARMRSDGSLRPTRPPRGLIVSTGEDIPRGQSLVARMVVVEISPDEIDVNCLTGCQTDAKNGLYATALASYLEWLASRLDAARKKLRRSVEAWRSKSLAHRRVPENLGQLAAGFDLFLDFATDIGAISGIQADAYRDRARNALLKVGGDQSRYQRADDPVARFLHLLAGAFASGEAHVADAGTGKHPEGGGGEAWGWSSRIEGQNGNEKEIWTPRGRQIGWVENDDVFLEPETAFACIQQLGSRQGTSLSIGQTTLWKRLDERGLLTSRDKDHCTTRKTTAAGRKRVIHLRADVLSRESGPTGPTEPNPAEADGERTTAQESCESWPNNRPTSGPNAHSSGYERSNRAASGPVGPLSEGETQADGEIGGDIEEGWV